MTTIGTIMALADEYRNAVMFPKQKREELRTAIERALTPGESVVDADDALTAAYMLGRTAGTAELRRLQEANEAFAKRQEWWNDKMVAIEQQAERDTALLRQALRLADDAVQPEASTTLEQADDHAHICSKLAEQYKSDPVLFAALTDAAAIIRDLMCGRLQTAKSVQTAWQRGFQQWLMPLKTGIPVLQGGEDVK